MIKSYCRCSAAEMILCNFGLIISINKLSFTCCCLLLTRNSKSETWVKCYCVRSDLYSKWGKDKKNIYNFKSIKLFSLVSVVHMHGKGDNGKGNLIHFNLI